MKKEKTESNLSNKTHKEQYRYKLLLVYLVLISCVTLLTSCQSEAKTLNNQEADIYSVEVVDGEGNVLDDDSTEIDKDDTSLELDVEAQVSEVEIQYEKKLERLETEELNQLEMNFLAKDIYDLWDDEINRVWEYLTDNLDKDQMDNLTTLQIEWISNKENEINKAGSEYEGGSIRPMIEHLKGAELTRERVYELLELIK